MVVLRKLLPVVLLAGLVGCSDKTKQQPHPQVAAWQNAAIADIKNFGGRYRLAAGEVTGIDFSNTQIADADLEYFKELASLQILDLTSTPITDAGLNHLNRLTNLRNLLLRNTQVTDTGLDHLADLSNLRSLYLDGTQVTVAGFEQLKGLTNLRSLWIFGGRYRLQGGEVVGVDFSNTQITDVELEQYTQGMTTIQSIGLRNTQITDAALEQLLQLTDLRRLDIRDIQITDAGLEYLKRLTNLKYLGIDTTAVSNAALIELSKALPKLRIRRPLSTARPINSVDRTQPDSEQEAAIAKLSQFSQFGGHYAIEAGEVVELYLADAQISDSGLESGAQIKNADLERLNGLIHLQDLYLVGNTQITDAGLEHLKGLTNLQNLNLVGNTQITDAGVAALNNALPQLTIVR